jgi:hypothetical protein
VKLVRAAPLAAGVGALAATAAAVFAVRGLAHTDGSPLAPGGLRQDLWTWGLAAAFVLYASGAALLRRRRVPIAAVAAVAAAIQLVPLVAPLLLSRDVYLYWDYGRIAEAHGGNPYADLPERWPDDPAFRQISSAWYREYSPYGPGWTLVSEADAAVSGSSPSSAAWIFRGLSAAGVLLLLVVVGLATRSAFALALVGWNPLLAVHFAGGGHNDAWMLALLVAAIALDRAESGWSGAAWALAVAVKWVPLIFLPLDYVRSRALGRRFPLRSTAVGATLFVAVSTALFGLHWIRSAAPISNQLREANSLAIPTQLGLGSHRGQLLFGAIFAMGYVLLLLRARKGSPVLGRTAVLLLVCVTWLVPWYGAWPVALSALEGDGVAQLLAVALAGYLLSDALPL